MEQNLQTVIDLLNNNHHLSQEEKAAIIYTLENADKAVTATERKLEHTEKELGQKRKAVEEQNRELEIEAALEKVRVIALAMKEPADMPEVCHIIASEMDKLGVKEIRNVQTAIFYENKGTYMNYEYYLKHDKAIVTETSYTNNETHKAFADRMLKGKGEFFSTEIDKAGLPGWIDYQKTTNVFIDTYLEGASSLSYHWYSLGPVALGISTYRTLNEKETELFRRFRNVFELAYKRYVDITNAEAQAREATIEAALEKVRSRSLAMHKSEEIKNVVVTVMEKMNELNIEMNGGVSLVTFVEGSRDLLHWYVNPGRVDEPVTMHLPYFDNVVFNDFVEARKAGKKILPVVYSFEEKNSYFSYAFEHSEFKTAPEELKKWILEQPYFGYSVAIQKHSAIFFNDYTGKLFSEKENDVLIRFGKVFEQSYIRFLDLQKAEAQAREARIEAVLERARTQSMIMQHSTELDDTLRVFHEQVLLLGIPSAFSFLWLPDEDKDRHIFWAAWAENNSTVFRSKAINYPLDRSETATAQCLIDWKSNQPVVSYHVPPEGVKNYFAAWSELIAGVEQLKPEHFSDGLYYVEAFMKYGCFGVMVKNKLQEDERNILYRFAVEFERTYTRFLDLQKAETQTRESQIQLALERVRARTMAMQRSDELTEAASLLFKQVQLLDIRVVSCGFNIWQKEDKACNAYMSDEAGFIQPPFKIPLTESPVFIHFAESRQKEGSFYAEQISGEELAAHYKYMRTLPVFSNVADNFLKAGFTFPEFQVNNVVNFRYGNLIFITYKPVPEAHEIFNRFGKTFEQTYTRFLDLQKAEAQAREAKIETALERVRSRSMGMQKSEELKEVIQIVYEQFVHLNINTEHTGFVMDYKERDDRLIWVASKYGLPSQFTIPYFDSVYYNSFNEAKEKGWDFFATNLSFEEKNIFYRDLFKYVPGIPEEDVKFYFSCPGLAISTVLLENVGLYIENFEGIPYSDEDNTILMRFGKVFQQTYTRFLDLQKAEAQARESQIQLALERVRARTMAMQKSDELAEAAQLLYQQFKSLGIQTINSAYMFVHEDTNTQDGWAVLPDGSLLPKLLKFPLTGESILDARYQSWKEKKTMHRATLDREENKRHHGFLAKHVAGFISEDIFAHYPDKLHFYNANFSKGYLLIFTTELLTEDEESILCRFAKVFEQTYTRFLDLQKSEKQAREAQIEASLERVRSKAMAMQKSDDLANAVAIVFKELDKLDLGMLRCGIGIINKESRSVNVWASTKSDTDVPVQVSGAESMDTHPLLQGAFNAWLNQQEYSYVLQGKDLTDYYKAQASANFKLPDAHSLVTVHDNMQQYYFVATFPAGGLFAFRETSFPEEAKTIIKRFADVFDFTYTRFNDLKQAEAQTREARIEAALERVRSRTLAMQESDELAETAAVLFKQLILLGIEPNRLYISIMTDKEGETEFWITDEDGSKVSMAYADNLNNNPSFKKMFNGWKRQKKSLIIDMKGRELQQYFNYFKSIHIPFKDGLIQKRRLQYIAYFNRGFIGMASPDEQPEETVFLLERFAAVFNLTFTRFNDLKIAEAHSLQAEEDLVKLQTEKRRAEDALLELQATQKQLVQSEKMASLGELTAGIAHEIQNPLNFVNNFSEVSKELIDELKIKNEELKIEDEEVNELLDDITQNLEKINHHGKRADAIVKGMLQHSRQTKGVKELTDINALCDEYLRLCYHGLRAKDNSFNATIKTDFDDTIKKIKIIAQDIGRVLLNLLTNAFYAVNERRKNFRPLKGSKEYSPTVTISTQSITTLEGSGVVITITDNGNGIPPNIFDKIFQPFFTTKPTGQGTGLGLSLSYDIIKAHAGEIIVETTEAEGSTFIIKLPASDT